MSKTSTRSTARRQRRWLTHGRLMGLEGVLLVNVAHEAIDAAIAQVQTLPPQIRILLLMASVAFALGGVLLVVEWLTERSVKQAHAVIQSLPIPTPWLLVHLLVLGGLYVLYGWWSGLQWGW